MQNISLRSFPKPWVAFTAAGAALVATAGAVSSFVFPEATEALTTQARDLASLLDARSPGEREVGELTKTKGDTRSQGKMVAADTPAPAPEERALGKVFQPRSSGTQTPVLSTQYDASFVDPMSGVPLSLLGPLPELQSGSTPVLSPPLFGGGGFIVPPGGGNAAVPPQVPPPATGNPGIQPEVPAVPEPSTWIILIVGFAICAGAMRRQRLYAPGLHQAA